MSCGGCGSETVKIHSRGLCKNCYQRWLRQGTTEYAPKPVARACEWCGKVEMLHAKGLCACCYQRWITTGTPEKKGREKAYGACSHCGKDGAIKAHGLCGTCYNRQLNTGTLEKQGRVRASGSCSHCGKEGMLLKGYCGACYRRAEKRGTPDKIRVKQTPAPCDSCGVVADKRTKGLCPKCYMRLQRHGHTESTRPETWGQSEKHTIYDIWNGMRQRCFNPKSPSYPHYGGRGVKICDRWGNFWNFVEDMGDRPSLGHSIDRIDNDGDYTPDNCKWSTYTEQARNRRDNVFTQESANRVREFLGAGWSVVNIANCLGVSYDAVYNLATKNIWREL